MDPWPFHAISRAICGHIRPNTSHLWPQINVNEGTYIIDWLPIDQLMIIYIYCILIDYVCRWLTIPVFHIWGSPVVTGRLGIMGSGGSSQARFMVNPNSAGFAIGFTCYFFLRLCLCFVCLPVTQSSLGRLLPSFSLVSSFKISLQPEVSTCWTLLMAWLWEFPWEDAITTWLFCKLPQADQVETARCRDLRLSKSVNIWELWLQGSLHVAWLVWRSWLRVLIVFGSKKVRPDHHFCTVRRL